MGLRFRGAARFSFVVAVAAFVGACSSVPEVTFVDDGIDGGRDASSEAGGDGGRADGGSSDWSCAPGGLPPPSDVGVCCGARLCIKCTASDCAKCDQEGCGGTPSDVCCRRNAQQMQCKPLNAC